MAQKVYKTTRKYQCPFCDVRLPRMDLIDHVQDKHEELIPENYTAARSVYDSINHTDHGTCMICKKPVYEWNEKTSRYNNLCTSKKCREKVREIALERHIRVYNTPTLLNDPAHQEEMLANRHISGKYKYSDGTVFTYTGKYEKAAIEFMDKVMNIPSKDIQMPGPILEYEYDGKKHSWITDIYYIPANLIIEVKDGGDNPNNRNMPEYRGKQKAKEIMITELGKFNYLRLTNNNFSQLLEALAEIKYENMDKKDATEVNMRYFINESLEYIHESNNDINSPKELSNWMRKNISYKHTGIFLSPEEVENNKYGDCHDQSYFEYKKLKEMKYSCGRLFMVEYSSWNAPGGATHTLCYYYDRGRVYWFENAWGNKAGIHGPYKSIEDLKKDVANNWQWSGNNDKLFMGPVKKVTPGMSLEEYVVACTPEKEPTPFATKYKKFDEVSIVDEEVGGIPPRRATSTWIEPYILDNHWDLSIGNDHTDTILVRDTDGQVKAVIKKDIEKEGYEPSGELLVYNGDDSTEIFNKLVKRDMSFTEALSILVGYRFRTIDEVALLPNWRYLNKKTEAMKTDMIVRGLLRENEILSGRVRMFDNDTPIKGSVILSRSMNGYFIHTPKDYYLSSDYYDTPESIPQNVIDTMADLYDQHKNDKLGRKN